MNLFGFTSIDTRTPLPERVKHEGVTCKHRNDPIYEEPHRLSVLSKESQNYSATEDEGE